MNFTRESIFITAVRAFFKTFAVFLGIGVGIFALAFGLSAISDTVSLPDKADLTVSSDANGNRKLLAETTPVLLRMDIHGFIGSRKLCEESVSNMLLSSREGILAKNRVKGILLHFNTPGGLATTSYAIFAALKEYKEKYHVPIYGYVDGMCASGGMYISAATDKMFSTPASIVGSIGVRFGPNFNFSDVMEKMGIQSLTLTAGKDKDALNPFRPWKEGEDASLKAVMADQYNLFVTDMVTNRTRIDREKLINVYGAQIFSAEEGKEIGYLDNGNASYDETIAALAEAAGIKEDEKYQVMTIEPSRSVLRELTENTSHLLRGKIEHVFPIGPYLTSDMSGQILYLYQP